MYLLIQKEEEYPVRQSCFPQPPRKPPPMPFAKQCKDVLYGQGIAFCYHLQELFVLEHLCPIDRSHRQVSHHFQTHSGKLVKGFTDIS